MHIIIIIIPILFAAVLLNSLRYHPLVFKSQQLARVSTVLCFTILTSLGPHKHHSMDSTFSAIVLETVTGKFMYCMSRLNFYSLI